MRLLIVLMLSSITVSAAEPTTATATDTTTQVLQRADKVGEWVSITLTNLADKLGTSVELLWPAFVREQLAEGIGMLVGAFVLLAFGLSAFWYLGKCRAGCLIVDEKKYQFGDQDTANAYQFLRFVILIMCMCFIVPMTVNSIPYLVAPEALALKSIMYLVR
jgi:hypothetical protein